MGLQAAGGFATFNITDGAQIRDISPILADAIYYDLHLLGNLNVDFANPATDILHWWNEDLLNADTVTATSYVSAATTSMPLTSNDGAKVHIGDLVVWRTDASLATQNPGIVLQVTNIVTDTLTTAWIASTSNGLASTGGSFAIVRGEQEGSDIGSDKSLTPTVRNNNTQILAGAYDVKVTGSQLARNMATAQMQDFVARQLSNRAIELKIGLSRMALYSVKSSTQGSATAYRYSGGVRDWISSSSGVTYSTSGAFSYSNLNAKNKTVVDNGVFPDTLVIGTDLVTSTVGFDSTNRRLAESDRIAGYTLQQIQLQQGNIVNIVVDSRVNPGDAFLLSNERIRLLPLQGRGMFVIAAVDFTDAKKRRVLAEWTMEVRNPDKAHVYFSNQT